MMISNSAQKGIMRTVQDLIKKLSFPVMFTLKKKIAFLTSLSDREFLSQREVLRILGRIPYCLGRRGLQFQIKTVSQYKTLSGSGTGTVRTLKGRAFLFSFYQTNYADHFTIFFLFSFILLFFSFPPSFLFFPLSSLPSFLPSLPTFLGDRY